jgi:hypothetical protein
MVGRKSPGGEEINQNQWSESSHQMQTANHSTASSSKVLSVSCCQSVGHIIADLLLNVLHEVQNRACHDHMNAFRLMTAELNGWGGTDE